MAIFRKKMKIGLALGSGGPRGLAHIGIIKSLIKNNIPIDYIAGSSSGAIIGGSYAATKNIKEIEGLALSTGRRKLLSLFFDPSIRQGLVLGNKLEGFIEEYTGKVNFSDLKIPFTAVATDMKKGKPVFLKKGKLAKALRISGSMPLVFKPVEKKNQILVDGGLSDPVPVDAVRKMGADFVIAIDLNDFFLKKKSGKFGFYKIGNNIINILSHNLSLSHIKHADFVVSVKGQDIDWRSVILFRNKRAKIITDNEKLMSGLMPKLKEKISQKSKTDFANLFDIFKSKK